VKTARASFRTIRKASLLHFRIVHICTGQFFITFPHSEEPTLRPFRLRRKALRFVGTGVGQVAKEVIHTKTDPEATFSAKRLI
jgi:hypothetical protein